ncbi:MAG: tyrosine-type recombinase/integrase [Bacteroidetes bacterium]|nr:tyrosine-type recombinase/integrase [Bacteroidota bacterium]
MNYLSDFLNWLSVEKRYSSNTVSSYRIDLEQFGQYISNEFGNVNPVEISKLEIKSWVRHLMQLGYSNRTVNRKVVATNRYFTFLQREGYRTDLPTESISKPKIPKRLAGYIEENVMSEVLNSDIYSTRSNALMDRLIIVLLYECGLRVSELINLKWNDVDFSRSEIKVLGKGNKHRFVPLSSGTLNLLNEFRPGSLKKGFLFYTKNGNCLYPMYISRLTKQVLGVLANIKKCNPHQLRHSFATHLLNNGSDINSIKELLGHSSLASTSVYTHNSIKRLQDIYKSSHPRK